MGLTEDQILLPPLPQLHSPHSTQAASKKLFSNTLTHVHLSGLRILALSVHRGREAGQHWGPRLPTSSGSLVAGPAFRTGSQRPLDSPGLFHKGSAVTAISCANVCVDRGWYSRPALPTVLGSRLDALRNPGKAY